MRTLLYLFLFTTCICFAQDYTYKITKYNVGDGVAHTDATSFAQDSNGIMWIGTYSGLNKFDGYRFKLFRENKKKLNSPFSNRIMDLVFDNNYIFLATQGGLVIFCTKTEKFIELQYEKLTKNSLKQERIYSIYAENEFIFLSTADGISIFKYETLDNKIILTEIELNGNIDHSIVNNFISKNGKIWVTSNTGLYFLTQHKNGTSFYLKKVTVLLEDSEINNFSTFFIDAENQVLLSNFGELLQADLYNMDNNIIKACNKKGFLKTIKKGLGIGSDTPYQITNIYKQNEEIWVATDYGLIQMDENLESYQFYNTNKGSRRMNLSSKRVNKLFNDQQNNLWIGTFGGGINIIDLNQNKFYLLADNSTIFSNQINSNFVRAVVEDNKGNLWIGTERNGLYKYDFKKEDYIPYHHRDNDANSISNNAIRSLSIDKKNQLWIGTTTGIDILNLSSNEIEHIPVIPGSEFGLSGPNIFDIKEDKFGQIWAASWVNGLNKITKTSTGNFKITQLYTKEYKDAPFSISSSSTQFIYTDALRPEVLVSTSNGINHIKLNNNGEIKELLHYKGIEGYKKTLSSNFIWPMVRLNDSIFYVGTIGGGLNKLTLSNKSPYGYFASLVFPLSEPPFSDIESLELDKNQNIWIGSNGLSKFNPINGDYKFFQYEDGLNSNNFKIGVSHYGNSGRMYFGGTDGITYFYPDQIEKDTSRINVILTELHIDNTEVAIDDVSDKNPIITSHINYNSKIKLKANNNDFSIGFSALNFTNPKGTLYKYQLEGYDNDWLETKGDNHVANYANLKYGRYRFKVLASIDGVKWNSNMKTLEIEIQTPWWWSLPARIAYFLLFVLLTYLAYRWLLLKRAYDISIIEKNQKEEISKLRMQFFTNISHEFRTPLTLIANPLEELIKGNVGKRRRVRYYTHMLRNSKRMLRLVNELMDFQKIETKAYALQPNLDDIENVIKEVQSNFLEFSFSKDINFEYVPKVKLDSFYFDKAVIEKILYNILGNAFKFTNKKGTITIELTSSIKIRTNEPKDLHTIGKINNKEDYVIIIISDTGRGINDAELPYIFDRFFHRNSSNPSANHQNVDGSGVGLSLVKSLVALHKGVIQVKSKENLGTTFYIHIPYTKNPFDVSDDSTAIRLSKSSLSPLQDQPNVSMNLSHSVDMPTLLIVEDNKELRVFMRENFEDEFNVIEAGNGYEALTSFNTNIPDIIISDVNMPIMNGIELCLKTKGEEKTKDIPFILLTSNQSLEAQLEGANAKADLYISKPFSIDVLKINIKNIIGNRKTLKHKIINNSLVEAHTWIEETKESEFLNKVLTIINDNLDRPDFDVATLSENLNMSRTNVYTKIKKLTNKSAGALIREIKLKKAVEYLVKEDLSVSEAMYKVGIQSQSYFTKIFKKQYGKTPSQFIKELTNGDK